MNVVGSAGAGLQDPVPPLADAGNDILTIQALLARGVDRWVLQEFLFVLFSLNIASDDWFTVFVVRAIDSSTPITVQSLSVSSPSDVVCENGHFTSPESASKRGEDAPSLLE